MSRSRLPPTSPRPPRPPSSSPPSALLTAAALLQSTPGGAPSISPSASSPASLPSRPPTTSSRETQGTHSRWRWVGGRATGATARRRSSPMPTRRRTDSRGEHSTPKPPTGMTRSASTCSIGTTCAPPPILMPTRSSSPARRSAMPASSAAGTRSSPPAPRARPTDRLGQTLQPISVLQAGPPERRDDGDDHRA